MPPLFQRILASPLGELQLIAGDDALVAALFTEHPHAHALEAAAAQDHRALDLAAWELEEYFAGARTQFATALAPHGTPFQQRVWAALREIPFGETRSYSEIARAIGQPRAVRAVGAANALNPLALFIPCHRVVGANGALTGYAGGLPNKEWLLAHERRVASQRPHPIV
jgi:methylated-DNA-[protein]-cysteine S-methyltransferase